MVPAAALPSIADPASDPPDEASARPARRGLWALGLLATGLVLCRWLEPDAGAALGIGCGLVAVAALTTGAVCRAAMMLAVVCFGAGWYTLSVLRVASDDLRVVAGLTESAADSDDEAPPDGSERASPRFVRLAGLVLDTPRARPGEPTPWVATQRTRGRLEFTLSVRAAGESGAAPADMRPASGRVIVSLAAPAPAASAGAWVTIEGRVSPIAAPSNPGQRDGRPVAWQAGVVGRMRAEGGSAVRPWEEHRAGVIDTAAAAWSRGVWWLRASAVEALRGDGGTAWGAGERADSARAMAGALLLGVSEPGLGPVEQSFARLGLLHALSISGFHLVVLAGAAGLAVRLLGDRGRLEPLVVALVVGVYVALVPAEAPILRSAFMVLGLMAARAAGRRYDAVSALAWTACALLVWRPVDLWSPGFQLSFGVTGALLWLGPRVLARWRAAGDRWTGAPLRGLVHGPAPRGAWALAVQGAGQLAGSIRAGVVALVAASVIAWLVSAAVLVQHTGAVSVLGILASVIVVPMITLLLWTGYALVVVGAAAGAQSWAHAALDWAVAVQGRAILWVTDVLDGAPMAVVYLPSPGWVWVLLTTACAWWWLARSLRVGAGDRRLLALSAASALWLAGTLVVASGLWRGSDDGSAWGLSLPRGRAVLVRGDGGSAAAEPWVLVDCGSATAPGLAAPVTVRAARALGAWRVGVLVLTSGEAASCSGVAAAAGPLGVRTVLMPAGVLAMARRGGGTAVGGMVESLERQGVAVVGVSEPRVLEFGAGSDAARLRIEIAPRDESGTEPGQRLSVRVVGPGLPGGQQDLTALGDAASSGGTAVPIRLPRP